MCTTLQGSPMADLLKWHHATVTTCHSKTKDLPDVVRRVLSAQDKILLFCKTKFDQRNATMCYKCNRYHASIARFYTVRAWV